jgi:hypothetical protein
MSDAFLARQTSCSRAFDYAFLLTGIFGTVENGAAAVS